MLSHVADHVEFAPPPKHRTVHGRRCMATRIGRCLRFYQSSLSKSTSFGLSDFTSNGLKRSGQSVHCLMIQRDKQFPSARKPAVRRLPARESYSSRSVERSVSCDRLSPCRVQHGDFLPSRLKRVPVVTAHG